MTAATDVLLVMSARPALWVREARTVPGMLLFCAGLRYHVGVSHDLMEPGWHVSVAPCDNSPAAPPEVWEPDVLPFMDRLAGRWTRDDMHQGTVHFHELLGR